MVCKTCVAHLVAVESFDETQESLERQGGGILPKRQLQGVCAELVQDFDEFYEQPKKPSIIEEEQIAGNYNRWKRCVNA